ncbi:MAG: cytidine deaminase, partial [bacterium]
MGDVTQEDLTQQEQELIEEAREALDNAYAPYSEFKVGAALRTSDGSIYRGCNVENASYGLTNCAERTAMFKAVSEGKREFTDIAIMLDVEEGVGAPCGACRQVMNEFNAGMNVLMGTTSGNLEKASLDQLLPNSFGANYLEPPEDEPSEPAR